MLASAFVGVGLLAAFAVCIYRHACSGQPARSVYSNLHGEPSEASFDGMHSGAWDGRAPTCCALDIADNGSVCSQTDNDVWEDFELDHEDEEDWSELPRSANPGSTASSLDSQG